MSVNAGNNNCSPLGTIGQGSEKLVRNYKLDETRKTCFDNSLDLRAPVKHRTDAACATNTTQVLIEEYSNTAPLMICEEVIMTESGDVLPNSVHNSPVSLNIQDKCMVLDDIEYLQRHSKDSLQSTVISNLSKRSHQSANKLYLQSSINDGCGQKAIKYNGSLKDLCKANLRLSKLKLSEHKPMDSANDLVNLVKLHSNSGVPIAYKHKKVEHDIEEDSLYCPPPIVRAKMRPHRRESRCSTSDLLPSELCEDVAYKGTDVDSNDCQLNSNLGHLDELCDEVLIVIDGSDKSISSLNKVPRKDRVSHQIFARNIENNFQDFDNCVTLRSDAENNNSEDISNTEGVTARLRVSCSYSKLMERKLQQIQQRIKLFEKKLADGELMDRKEGNGDCIGMPFSSDCLDLGTRIASEYFITDHLPDYLGEEFIKSSSKPVQDEGSVGWKRGRRQHIRRTVCRHCGAAVKYILSHLSKSFRCQEQYDMTALRAQSERTKLLRQRMYPQRYKLLANRHSAQQLRFVNAKNKKVVQRCNPSRTAVNRNSLAMAWDCEDSWKVSSCRPRSVQAMDPKNREYFNEDTVNDVGLGLKPSERRIKMLDAPKGKIIRLSKGGTAETTLTLDEKIVDVTESSACVLDKRLRETYSLDNNEDEPALVIEQVWVNED